MFDFDPQPPGTPPEPGTPVPPGDQPTEVFTPATDGRRRKIRIAVLAAVGALLLAVPAAAVARFAGDGDRPAGEAGRAAPGVPATTSPADPTATPPATTGPDATQPGAEAAAVGLRPAPNGMVTIDELAHATVDLPAWPQPPVLPCPSGHFTFHGNPTQVGPSAIPSYLLKIQKVAYVDVDRDAAKETVALIACYLQGGDMQAVAFDRDSAGHIVTIGLVVASSRDGPIEALFDVRPAGGQVQVEVGDLHPCCGVTSDMAEHQWRTYGYTGRDFVQTGGPKQFTQEPRPTHLAATATALHFGAATGGVRHGTFTVTVVNTGAFDAPGAVLTLDLYLETLPQPITITAPGCPVTTIAGGAGSAVLCHTGPLASGAQRQYTFDVALPQADDPVIPTASNPRTGTISAQGEQPGLRLLPYWTSTELLITRDA